MIIKAHQLPAVSRLINKYIKARDNGWAEEVERLRTKLLNDYRIDLE